MVQLCEVATRDLYNFAQPLLERITRHTDNLLESAVPFTEEGSLKTFQDTAFSGMTRRRNHAKSDPMKAATLTFSPLPLRLTIGPVVPLTSFQLISSILRTRRSFFGHLLARRSLPKPSDGLFLRCHQSTENTRAQPARRNPPCLQTQAS